jgi:hypothetical protein
MASVVLFRATMSVFGVKRVSIAICRDQEVSDPRAGEEYMLAKRWTEHQDTSGGQAGQLAPAPRRQDRMGYRGYGLPVAS